MSATPDSKTSLRSVGRSIAGGAAWMACFRVLERMIGVLSTVILARLLIPADFGMIAMAMSLVAILELLWAFSFDAALIQQSNIDRSHYDTAWTLNIGLSLVVAAGLLVLAYPAARFYDDDRLVPLICCLAVGSLFRGFENVGVVAFRKDLRFGMEFAYQISRKIAGFLVTIPLAFLLRNYWALAAGMVTGRLAALVLSYFAHPFRPRLSIAAHRTLLNFSKWLFFNSVLFALQTRSQDFVIGKIAGASGLGLYNVSYDISTMPTTEVVYPINRVAFPGFAKLTQDPDALIAAYVRVLAVVAMLTVPAGVGIAATAGVLIPTVLGPKWLDAVPVVQVLGLYGALAALGSVFSPTFMALGKARLLSVLTAINVALFVPAVIFGAMTNGVLGAAWASLAVVATVVPLSHWFAARVLGLALGKVLGAIWRPFLASALMFSIVRPVAAGAESSMEFGPLFVRLASCVGLGVVIYVAAILLLWVISGRPQGAEYTILRTIRTAAVQALARTGIKLQRRYG